MHSENKGTFRNPTSLMRGGKLNYLILLGAGIFWKPQLQPEARYEVQTIGVDFLLMVCSADLSAEKLTYLSGKFRLSGMNIEALTKI